MRTQFRPVKKSIENAYYRALRVIPSDIAIFHQFRRPPTGGGSQFLATLVKYLRHSSYRVGINTISSGTKVCLVNSFNFDQELFESLRRTGIPIIHRVDGPIASYRGYDDGTDNIIARFNAQFADLTIFQSQYSQRQHLELGFRFKHPEVIYNSVDPQIFNLTNRNSFKPNERVRLIASSWSDNPNKGAPVFKWLESHLDWKKYSFTFIGRSPIQFETIKHIPPVHPNKLSQYLKTHDVYLFASKNEPCSNALLEALACGLPVIYFRSGSNAELVQEGGLGFDDQDQIPDLLDEIVSHYHDYQSKITIPGIREVTDSYLKAMGMIP